MEKLSSGLRINRAGDDAAGLAISEKMRGQIRGLDMAAKNAQDGVSLIQTAEGALNETHSILQRMKELATQAANDANTVDDRKEIQKEMNQLTSEINRIGNTTEFNTQKLLDGTKGTGLSAVSGTGNLAGGIDAGSPTKAVYSFTIGAANITAGKSVTIGSETFIEGTNFAAGVDMDATGAALATAISSGTTYDAVYDSSSDKITLTQKIAAAGAAPTVSTDDGTMTVSAVTTDTPYAAGGVGAKATDTIAFNSIPAEGDILTINGEKIAFFDRTADYANATDAKTAYSSQHAIDINGLTKEQIAAAVAGLTVTGVTLSNPSGADIKVDASTTGTAGNSISTSYTSAARPGLTFQIGASTGQSFTAVIEDMRSDALDISSTDKAVAKSVVVDGKTYQVKWNSEKAVTNGTDSTGAEFALDVTSHDNATAAIKVLDDAINKVSGERSKLGAYQNRLEHTINNLGTSSENLTAAESRIRDVDYALAA